MVGPIGKEAGDSCRDRNSCLRLTNRRRPHAERLRRPCGDRRNLFEEETRLGDRSEMDGKKGAMISTTEIIAFRLLKEAGTEEFRRLPKLLK